MTRPTYTSLRAILLALPLMSGACGGGGAAVGGKAFSQDTLNDEANGKAQQNVVDRLKAQPPGASPDAVVAVTGTGEITGMDLSSGKTWTYKHVLESRPQLAGPLVIGQGGGEVFAVDALSGTQKWVTKAKGKLIGAGSDGKWTALTMKVSEGSAFYILNAEGSIKTDKITEMPLTDPAVVGGMVLVPWKALYVTAFEASSGDQIATFVTDTETTHVLPIGGAVFAGQGRLVRFDEGILKAKQGGSTLAVPPKELPNVSRRDLYVPPDHGDKVTSDAIDYTVLAGRPNPSGPAGFVGDRVYGGYYRLMMGWSAKDGKLAWVHTGKDDVVAAAAAKDGVVVVDKAGNVKLLGGAGGTLVKTMSLGKPVMSADVFVDNLSVGGGAASKDLTDQLKEAVTLKADELATAQAYLLEQAAAIPDEDATGVLLEVADSERTAGGLRDTARAAIALRTNGAKAMIALLARHANFLKDTRTPPVGPMAKALATMKEKSASQPLIDQLLDPALPNKDLLQTAEGVAALSSADQVPHLKRFISMYRGSATGNITLGDSISVIAGAILRLDGDKGKEWLASTAKDPLTDTDVRTSINKALDAAAPKKKDEPKDEPKVEDKPKKKKVVDEGPEPPGYKKKKEQEEKDKAEKDKKKKGAEEKKEEKKDDAPPPEGDKKKKDDKKKDEKKEEKKEEKK